MNEIVGFRLVDQRKVCRECYDALPEVKRKLWAEILRRDDPTLAFATCNVCRCAMVTGVKTSGLIG